jgi:uncharacterized protein YndB with AHSA1/START domain
LKKEGTTMPGIVIELAIAAAPQRVWNALTQPDEIGHWWTNDLNAKPEVGSLAEFRFGEWGDFALLVEVAELEQDEKVHWIHRRSPVAQWAGTIVTWQLKPDHNGTMLVFRHDGFVKKDEVYEQTRRNWDSFLASLKSYLETGKGTPGVPPYVR